MLDLDSWQEIFETLRRNKLRTFLTAFSVAWGIFMLVVLLGSGVGLSNGVNYQFRDDAINSLWIYPGETTLAYAGLQPGRRVQLDDDDYADARDRTEGAEHVSARFYLPGPVTVVHGRETAAYDVRSVHPDHLHLEKTRVVRGRFLDDLDLSERRKVAVVGKAVQDGLFHGQDPLGSQIQVNGVAFKVVGVFEDAGGQSEMEKIYLPITTAQRTFNGGRRIHQLMLTVGDASLEESQRMAQQVQRRIAARHHFSPDDERAVRVVNNVVQFERFHAVTSGIRAFTWLVGIGTILAGIVGVSNIMLITVRERTREIGIRKALGATPGSIVAQVLQESVLVTAIAGFAGLVLGVLVLDVASRLIGQTDFFRNPQVDISTALEATLVLVVAGTLAGLFPARRAAAIRPVEALREE